MQLVSSLSTPLLLADEVIQIILNEIDDPTSFSLTSKRIYTFTQVPYVRASYFISRYGKIQALYWALGRGRLMNERVIDVCGTTYSSPSPRSLCFRLIAS